MLLSSLLSSFYLLLLLLVSASTAQQQQQEQQQTLEARCGDCWCVPEGGVGNGTCPDSNLPGLYQSFPPEWPATYATFVLDQEPLQLQAADGSPDCFPFADALGPLSSYPQSNFPQCVLPQDDSDVVCGFQYTSTDTPCRGKAYTVQQYASLEALTSTDGGAQLIHSGPCGVCSTAQDLSVRMATFDAINPISVACATNYLISPDLEGRFDKLIQCYTNIGFSPPCATLWAHFAATNANVCAVECVPDVTTNQIPLFLDPPFCPAAPCVACGAAKFEGPFNQLAGIWLSAINTGLVEELPYPCDAFTAVPNLGPPCVLEDAVPTRAPTGTSGAKTRRSVLAAVAVSTTVLVLATATV